MAGTIDAPRRELEEIEDERERLLNLAKHGATDEDDLDELRVVEEKLERRRPPSTASE